MPDITDMFVFVPLFSCPENISFLFFYFIFETMAFYLLVEDAI